MDTDYRLYFNFIDSLIALLYISQDHTLFHELLQFCKKNIGRYVSMLGRMSSQQIHFRKVIVLIQISVLYNIISLLGTNLLISKE